MPGQTPIYSFIYPCPDEGVSPLDFQILANQIDAKLVDLRNDYTLMLNRPNFDTVFSPVQTIPANVDTVLTSPLVTYVVPMSGVYVFYAHAFAVNQTGAWNMHRLRIRQNATARFGQTQNTEGSGANPADAAGPIVATAGDVITLTWLFNGSGTEDVRAKLAAKMLVRTA